MVDHIVDSSERRGRIDIRVGVGVAVAGVRRRRVGSWRNPTRPERWHRKSRVGTR